MLLYKEYLNKLNDMSVQISDGLVIEDNIVFSGIGKSGNIACKLNETANSLGIKSKYINGSDLCHGSLTSLDNEQIIFLSKSGLTREYVWLREKYDNVVIMTCNNEMPDIKRILINNVNDELIYSVPTISSTAMLIVGESLLIQKALDNKFDDAKYRRAHV